MKKTAVISALAVLLNVSLIRAAYAQAGFVLGMVLGSSMSGGDEVIGSGNANILYVMPRAAERVKDPLKIRLRSTDILWFAVDQSKSEFRNDRYTGGMHLRQIFARVEPNTESFEVLQVMRVFHPQHVSGASVWFAYTEKENVIPLKNLPKSKKSSN